MRPCAGWPRTTFAAMCCRLDRGSCGYGRVRVRWSLPNLRLRPTGIGPLVRGEIEDIPDAGAKLRKEPDNNGVVIRGNEAAAPGALVTKAIERALRARTDVCVPTAASTPSDRSQDQKSESERLSELAHVATVKAGSVHLPIRWTPTSGSSSRAGVGAALHREPRDRPEERERRRRRLHAAREQRQGHQRRDD